MSDDSTQRHLGAIDADPQEAAEWREALASLASHKHADSIATVRHAIDEDPSYYAAAEGLKSLVKLDRAGSHEVLLAALARDSHQDVVLKAACDGLVELKESSAVEPLAALLEKPLAPSRRAGQCA